MFIRSATIALLTILTVSPAVAGPLERHSAGAVYHSGRASSEGVSALATGGAIVSSVPITAFGSALKITGSAIESVGDGALEVGGALSQAGKGHAPHVTPNGPPRLD